MQVKKGEIFNSVQVAALPKNIFDLTHQHATTMDFSDLVPICCMEAVPGDNWNIGSETFIRFQPLITPMMHRCDFTVHYFFVPNRILWPGWEDFITGNQAVTAGLNVPTPPVIPLNTIDTNRGSLFNYFGGEIRAREKATALGFGDVGINALPFAAYQKIYWDYYVPKELQPNPTTDFVPLADGVNTDSSYFTLRQKGWIRDYFTSALPYAQKGAAVDIPLGDIVLKDNWDDLTGWPHFEKADGFGPTTVSNLQQEGIAPNNAFIHSELNPTEAMAYNPMGTLTAQATTINDLRRAMRLQEWLEKNARAGTRYTESLRAHFNVISSDARLQRAEYITGVKSPIIVSEVLNTTGTEELPQGNMAGHAIGIADSYDDSFFCEEHGWIIGLLSVTPRPAYTTGIPRCLIKRNDMLDYYWYEFANIGEQEIINFELNVGLMGEAWDGTFGYIPRYSEYKFKNDMITGEFADDTSTQGGPLRTWVMQRTFGANFGGHAVLNSNFITGDIKSVASAPFAVEDNPILVQHVNKLKAARLMPVYGTPTF